MDLYKGIHSDKFFPIPLAGLYSWIVEEYRSGTIFGIPVELFFRPSPEDNFQTSKFGRLLETPVGLAAGPHTQMAQNIVAGWLTGARYIELKTIQDLDDIEVSKPCIDMRDEGYNCEWSQELRIDNSYSEYLKAWILIHLLREKLNLRSGKDPGFIFNMSAGYNMSGISGVKVRNFLKRMKNSREDKARLIEGLYGVFPEISDIDIPDMITDNITVSTMHGTPPEEVEKIGRFFIREAGLHTIIKLNPTLLGPEKVRRIINKNLGYDVEIPDSAFEHDLKYNDALDLVKSLRTEAEKQSRFFGLKLTNTLECINPGDIFSEEEKMAYMSGQVLHPVAISIAEKFRKDLSGEIGISFSAGVDAFNLPEVISSNLIPVTMSSDILKPGGFGKLNQYIRNLSESISSSGSSSINEFIQMKSGKKDGDIDSAALYNLSVYAGKVINAPEYKRLRFSKKETKTNINLNRFDCIKAPCTESCGTSQDVPEYMHLTAQGKFKKAFETVFLTNPFPNVTGMVCDHLCQTKCTRSNYDNPLKIREIKRFLAEKYGEDKVIVKNSDKKSKKKIVSIIGAGPSGMSCAYFLSKADVEVKLYEKEDKTGGMVRKVIPDFRLGKNALETDLNRIKNSGAEFEFKRPVGPKELEKIRAKSDYVYISIGADRSVRLEIEGIDSPGVIDPIVFLSRIKSGEKPGLGKNIAVIGGGNTAIDSARTALRAGIEGAKVTILYRRTKKEMPADRSEIISALEEGINIIELIAPEKILTGSDGEVAGLRCFRTRLSRPDRKGKIYPVKIDGSEKEFEFDTVIPAVGQRPEPSIFEEGTSSLKRSGRLLRYGNVIVGGDAASGTSTVVNAVGDGRAAAALIIEETGESAIQNHSYSKRKSPVNELRIKRSERIFGDPLRTEVPEKMINFGLLTSTLNGEEAVKEASRCLLCDELCDTCVTVCPNRANISYKAGRLSKGATAFGIKESRIKIIGHDKFSVDQEYQVLNITDLCNHCGNCTTFCPTSGEPFKDKIRISLSKESFDQESDVFGVFKKNGDRHIIYKSIKGDIDVVVDIGNSLCFVSGTFNIELDKKSQTIKHQDFFPSPGVLTDMKICSTLSFLIDSIPDYLFKTGEIIDFHFDH